MATIAEVRARRAEVLAEEKRQYEAEMTLQRANILAHARKDLESYLNGLGLDYVLADGEAVALIESYRIRHYDWTWEVEKDGVSAIRGYSSGSHRIDDLLQAFEDVDAAIARRAQQPEQPAAPLPVPADPFLGLEPAPTLESRIAALETIIESMLQRVEDLEGSQSVSRLEADCAGVNGSIF